MSTAIIKFEDEPNKMIYWKDHSYPTGIGFKLLSYYNDETNDLYGNKDMFEIVTEIPKDIQYEYIIKHDHTIHCQECWWTSDKSYHGGGFRHGGVYDLVELKNKIELQNKYSIRREEDWNNKPIEEPKWKFIITKYNKFKEKYIGYNCEKHSNKMCKCSDIIEYEADDITLCKDMIFDLMDIVLSKKEIDDDWVRKEYMSVEQNHIESIKRYYNGRLELYNKIISDIDNYISIDNNTRRNTIFHYDIPEELNSFSISDEYKNEDIQENAYIELKITL